MGFRSAILVAGLINAALVLLTRADADDHEVRHPPSGLGSEMAWVTV